MIKSVLVVVLNWNGIKDTQQCLDSLMQQTYKKFDVVVVDNGSIDDSVKKLRDIEAKRDNITLLTNATNNGFAGGVNVGISYAINNDYDAVALFNNDAVADKNWLTNLVAELKDENISIVTGLLLHEHGKTIDSTGDYYSMWGMPFPRGRGNSTKTASTSGFVFGASGGASLYRTSLFKEIGLFDESFFAYYEDVDISFRAQLAGHKVYYTNSAIAYHKQGATSSKIPGFTVYQTFKNIPLLFTKNVPTALIFPIGIRLILLYWLIFGNAIKNGSGVAALKGWLASVWYFWTKALWGRLSIQSNKKVSADYIKSLLWNDLPPEQTGVRKFRKFFTGKN
jgi:GT2 family glycosyltransferase